MTFEKKRWFSLSAGFLIEAMLGIVYAWSVFQTPFVDRYGWRIGEISIAYTMMFICVMLISAFFGTRVRKSLSIHTEIMIGGIIYAVSVLGLSFMRENVLELYFWWGLVLAIGTAFSYPVLISYSQEIFPEKTGFAGGIMTAGYGIGSVIWAPLTNSIYQSSGNIGTAFRILGIVFLIGITALSFLLYEAPADFRTRMLSHTAQTAKQSAGQKTRSLYDIPKKEMLQKPEFYALMLMLILGMACGGMLVTQGSPLVVERCGLTTAMAAVIVSAMSIFNMSGRIVWGAVSDRLGKVKTMTLLHLLMGLSVAGLMIFSTTPLFLASLFLALLAYGGMACMIAPATAELFGSTHISENYTVTFCSFGLSSLVGPTVISSIRQSSGSYSPAFLIAIVFSAVGIAAGFYLICRQRKKD